MFKFIALIVLTFVSLASFSQPQNIVISTSNQPEEPSICINPKNPALIMAGSNINNWHYSTDTGRTWVNAILQSNYAVWGDPCIITDSSGNFHFFHLSNPIAGNWIDRIVAQKFNPNTQQWVSDTHMGLNGTKAQDKEWAIVDYTTNSIYCTWTQFDNYGSENQTDSSIILFSKSLDEGLSWSATKRLNTIAGDCIDSDSTVEGATPAVGPNGEVYVCWVGAQGLYFNKSLDKGTTWLAHEQFICSVPGGWDYSIPGISRCNGLPILVCDNSNGPNRGNLYINWSDQRNGSNNTDIWLVKSSDGGQNWSAPTKVNNDTTNRHQFFTWMNIDQETGYLYFVFYDRRNHADNQTDVYLAISKNGGISFSNYLISESPFTPNATIFFGDYTNISVYKNIIRPIWARMENNQLSILTALIDANTIEVGQNEAQIINGDYRVFPNPTHGEIAFSIKLKTADVLNLWLCDSQGKRIKQLYSERQYTSGMYIENIDIEALNLASGVYFFVVESEKNYHRSIKFMVE